MQPTRLTRPAGVATGAHQFLRGNLVLACNQLVDCIVIFQEHLHADERFPTFLCQHVPRFWPRQEIRDAALGKS